jgi:hypothetical protein
LLKRPLLFLWLHTPSTIPPIAARFSASALVESGEPERQTLVMWG